MTGPPCLCLLNQVIVSFQHAGTVLRFELFCCSVVKEQAKVFREAADYTRAHSYVLTQKLRVVYMGM